MYTATYEYCTTQEMKTKSDAAATLTRVDGLIQTEDERQTEFYHSSSVFTSYQPVKVHLREEIFEQLKISSLRHCLPKNLFIPLPSPKGRDLDTSKLIRAKARRRFCVSCPTLTINLGGIPNLAIGYRKCRNTLICYPPLAAKEQSERRRVEGEAARVLKS